MVLQQSEMTMQQVANCRLLARAVSGEYKYNFHLLDIQNVVFYGNSEPGTFYQGVSFSIGKKRFSALYAVDRGIFCAAFGKGDLPENPLDALEAMKSVTKPTAI